MLLIEKTAWRLPRQVPGRSRNLPGRWGKVKQFRAFPGLTDVRSPVNFTPSFRYLSAGVSALTLDPRSRARWPRIGALLAALSVGLAACDDDPFAFNWDPTPDTVLLYSLARPELNLVSAFAFFQRTEVRVEAAGSTGEWDAAVDTRDGRIVLLPPGALGVVGTARITEMENMRLEDVRRAPGDTLVYSATEPIPVEMGNVYVIKTNRAAGSFGSSCVYYAKMAPVTIDPTGGTLVFEYVTNPVCNSQDLVPPN